MRLLVFCFVISMCSAPIMAAGNFPGITTIFTKNELSVYLDQNSILKIIPRLQKKGIVDANLSKAEVSFYDTELPAMVSIPYVTHTLRDFYTSNKKNDEIQVVAYLSTRDLYGNKTNIFCYSFNFNRQLFQQINWKHFQASNLVKIAPYFKTSKECKVLEETSPQSI